MISRRELLLGLALSCFLVAVIVPALGGNTRRARFAEAGAAFLTASLLFG